MARAASQHSHAAGPRVKEAFTGCPRGQPHVTPHATAIIKEYQAWGYVMTVRQVYWSRLGRFVAVIRSMPPD